MTRADDGFSANILETRSRPRAHARAAPWTVPLYVAVNSAGGTDRLAVELADVFKYDIDFVNSVQPGDSFVVAHERDYQDGVFVRDGDHPRRRVRQRRQGLPRGALRRAERARRLLHAGWPPGAKGVPALPGGLRAHQLRLQHGAPPSGPDRVRAHKGIDFAAPTGTPIKAAGAGRIVSRAPQRRLCGNVIVLAHSGRRDDAVRPHVALREGPVGRIPGRTGPGDRLCRHDRPRDRTARALRIPRERRAQNPAKVTVAKPDPIPASLMADFKAQTTPLLARLDANAPAPVQVRALLISAGGSAGR